MSRLMHARKMIVVIASLMVVIMATNAFSVFAAVLDDPEVSLDISKGSVIITETGYAQNGEAETSFVGRYVITGTTNKDTIIVKSGTISLQMDRLTIHAPEGSKLSALNISVGASINLSLNGASVLCGDTGSSGIAVPVGSSLVISSENNNQAHILRAYSRSSKGGTVSPGGNGIGDGGYIEVSNGAIIASGGGSFYGIGGAGISGNLTVNGGFIMANGGGVYRGQSGVGLYGDLFIISGYATFSGRDGFIGGGNGITGGVTAQQGYLEARGGSGPVNGDAIGSRIIFGSSLSAFISGNDDNWLLLPDSSQSSDSQHVIIRNTEKSNDAFLDVSNTDWNFEAVNFSVSGNLINSISSTQFFPNITTTRAAIAVSLFRLAGGSEAIVEANFLDLPTDSEIADAISWASLVDIVNGYGNGRFGPDDSITREQFAVMLYRLSKWRGDDVSHSVDLSGFADENTVSDWARLGVKWAVATGLIEGTDTGKLNPQFGITRAEAATMLMRYVWSIF